MARAGTDLGGGNEPQAPAGQGSEPALTIRSGDGSHRFARWLYRGGRPNALAKAMNRFSAALFARAPLPASMARVEVVGRRSGTVIAFPMVIADYEGERYLVSMLGEGTTTSPAVVVGLVALAATGLAAALVLAGRHPRAVQLSP